MRLDALVFFDCRIKNHDKVARGADGRFMSIVEIIPEEIMDENRNPVEIIRIEDIDEGDLWELGHHTTRFDPDFGLDSEERAILLAFRVAEEDLDQQLAYYDELAAEFADEDDVDEWAEAIVKADSDAWSHIEPDCRCDEVQEKLETAPRQTKFAPPPTRETEAPPRHQSWKLSVKVPGQWARHQPVHKPRGPSRREAEVRARLETVAFGVVRSMLHDLWGPEPTSGAA
jgi:hypothetical protein